MAKYSAVNNSQPASSAGLTLIGVLVAILVFATILMATFNLMGRTTREIGRSRENFTATNLAREGLELVQFIRDTNMQTCVPGNTNPACSTPPTWTGNVTGGQQRLCDGDETKLIIDGQSGVNVRVRPWVTDDSGQLYLKDGKYQHDVTDQSVPYRRQITIDCTNQATDNDEHIEVESRVTWASRGETREVVLRNRLFNWYQ